MRSNCWAAKPDQENQWKTYLESLRPSQMENSSFTGITCPDRALCQTFKERLPGGRWQSGASRARRLAGITAPESSGVISWEGGRWERRTGVMPGYRCRRCLPQQLQTTRPAWSSVAAKDPRGLR